MAPTIVGTNELTQAEDLLIDTIAALSSFQTLTGTGDAPAAKARIFVDVWDGFVDPDDDEETERQSLLDEMPYLLITSSEDSQLSVRRYATGNPYQFQCDISFMLSFRLERPSDFKGFKEDKIREFKNGVGDVILELMSVSGTGGKFDMSNAHDTPIDWSQEDINTLPRLWYDWIIQRLQEES